MADDERPPRLNRAVALVLLVAALVSGLLCCVAARELLRLINVGSPWLP